MLWLPPRLYQPRRDLLNGDCSLKIKLQARIHGVRLIATRPCLQRVMQVSAEARLPLYGDPQTYHDAIASDTRAMHGEDPAIAVGQTRSKRIVVRQLVLLPGE